jgi:hypothetical protein
MKNTETHIGDKTHLMISKFFNYIIYGDDFNIIK